jgi:hypothetical protein
MELLPELIIKEIDFKKMLLLLGVESSASSMLSK